MAMGVAYADTDTFNILLHNCTKVEFMSCTTKYYIAVAARWVREIISEDIGTV